MARSFPVIDPMRRPAILSRALRMRSLHRRRDVLQKVPEWHILLFFFVLGPLPALAYFLDHGYTFFYQTLTPESVLWACDYGLQHPREIIAPLNAFLTGEARELTCASLGTPHLAGPASLFSKVQPYFTWSAAFLWHGFGLSYISLIPLLFVLYGTYASGCYALSRLFLTRRLAVTAATLLTLAPLTVGMVLYLRDFSKAPFFVWSIVFLIKAIRADDSRHSIIFASISAAVIGIGYGFRTDLVALLPIGVIVLALGVRPVHAGHRLLRRFSGILAPVAFALTVTVVSAPIWTQLNVGGVAGTFMMQGATEPFRIATGLVPAGYAVGWAYSDELTLSGVAATERLTNPAWDAQEMSEVEITGLSAAIRKSSDHLSRWADVFVADFGAQALKSAGWILGFPALLARSGFKQEYASADRLQSFSPVRLTLIVYSLFGQGWFVYLGALGVSALLFQTFVRSRREALCLLILLAFLTAYPSVQFSHRHIFHLEFVWVISTLSLLSISTSLRREWKQFPGFAAYALAVSVLVATGYMAALQYQRWALSTEIVKLLALPRQQVTASTTLLDNGDRLFEISVPLAYRVLTDGKTDSMTPDIAYKGAAWDVRAAADRLLVHVSGEACTFSGLKVIAKYAHTPQTWQPLDAEIDLLEAPTSGTASFLLPAFYRATQHLRGIVVPKAFGNCNVLIDRIQGDSRLPFVLTANLEGSAILGRTNKGIGDYDIQANSATVTRSATISQ